MHRTFFFTIAFLSFLLGYVTVNAGDFGTKSEAVALVSKAIIYAKQVGMDKAAVEFSNRDGKWVDRDLYLIVVDKAGLRVAHGQNAKMIGKSYFETIDINGKAYGQELKNDLAAGKSKGWIEYYFTDPVTKKQLPKIAYWEKDGDYVFTCGVYIR